MAPLAEHSKGILSSPSSPSLGIFPNEVLHKIIENVIPLGRIVIIDPYLPIGTITGIPRGALNIALVSKHFATLAFKVLYNGRQIEIGTDEIAVYHCPIEPPSNQDKLVLRYGRALSALTTVPVGPSYPRPASPIVRQSKWDTYRRHLPKRHEFDTSIDCLEILLIRTIFWRNITHLRIHITHRETKTIHSLVRWPLVDFLPSLKVLQLLLSPTVQEYISIDVSVGAVLWALANKLDHVHEVIATRTDPMPSEIPEAPTPGFLKLVEKLSQRNSNWAAPKESKP